MNKALQHPILKTSNNDGLLMEAVAADHEPMSPEEVLASLVPTLLTRVRPAVVVTVRFEPEQPIAHLVRRGQREVLIVAYTPTNGAHHVVRARARYRGSEEDQLVQEVRVGRDGADLVERLRILGMHINLWLQESERYSIAE
jgi:epoxyqueuosine reductase QueG